MLLLQRDWSLETELPKYLADKKDGKVNKGIFDIHVIDVYLTNSRSIRLLIFLVGNRDYGLNEDWPRTR